MAKRKSWASEARRNNAFRDLWRNPCERTAENARYCGIDDHIIAEYWPPAEGSPGLH